MEKKTGSSPNNKKGVLEKSPKSKTKQDKEREQTLKDSFPASDPPSTY